MKQIIILTFAVLFCYISEAQQVFQATSFILNQPENGNVEYKASDYIKLVDGFHYKADDNTSFWGHIDPYLVMPPTTGLTGGSNSGDHGVAKLFDGKFGVSPYGSATYNIPIDIPNGINGCQPQISLNYNSSGSVGIMGEGWTIGGISCIEQVPSTYSYDGYAQAIILNEMNPLVLNGRLLKLVDPANFVYRYEEDDQTIIKAINPNDQSQGFIVLSPDGKKSYYGTNSDSRFCLQSNSTIVAWYIEKTEDQHGNSYTFQYEKDLANGGIYPSSVSYTQNTEKSISSFYEIVFHYKPWNVPPKKYLSYIDNTTNYSQINRLLDSISIKYIPQNKVIDGYKLWYSIPTLDFVKTPQLISVTRKNEKDQINPIKFDWHDYNYSNSTDNLTYPIEANFGYKVNITVENFNINNDGLSDVVVKFNEGPFSSGPDNQLMIYENTSNPNNNNYQLTLKHHLILSNYLDDLGHCVYGDFNGDNITEILQIYEGESGNVEGYIGHYDSFGNYIEGDNCLPQGFKVNGTYRIVCSDFSGDGKLDLAFFVKELSFMKILFLVSDADGIFSNLLPSITTETYGYEDHIFSGDFYGDGKTSILFCPGGGNNNGINYNYLIRLNNSSDMAIKTIFAPISNDDLYRNILTGDFNGDNRTDVVRLYEESNNLDILLCNGHGGFIQVGPFTISEITNWNNYGIYTSDLNEDGCSDISMIINSNIGTDVSVSDFIYNRRDIFLNLTGLNTLQNKVVFYSDYIDFIKWEFGVSHSVSPPVACFGNFLGYNNNSILYVSTSETQRFVLSDYSQNISNRKITKIVNSFGESLELTYKPLCSTIIYPINYSVDSFPLVPDLSARNIVSVFKKNYGSQQYENKLFYGTGWIHVQGRGFLGFSHLGIENNAENTYTADYNTIKRPYFIPVTYKKVLYTSSGGTYNNPISSTSYKYIFRHTGVNKTWHYTSDISQTIENTFTENAVLFNTIKTEYKNHDLYRFPKKIKISYSTDGTTYLQAEEHDLSFQHINTGDKYLLGLKEYDSVTYTNTGTNNINHFYQYQYVPNSSLLQTITNDPGTAYQLTTSYTYDDFGNIKSATKACNGYPSRSDSTIFSPDGRFLIRTKNPKSHMTTFTYDPVTGNKLSETDANGLTSTFYYDSFGDLEKTILPDGKNIVQVTRWIDESIIDAPDNALFYTWTKSSGAPLKKVFYNRKGQVLRESAEGALNKLILKDYKYYTDKPFTGLIHQESNPYFFDEMSGPPIGKTAITEWTEYSYNCKREPNLITKPNGSFRRTYSSQRDLFIEDFDGHTTVKEFNGAGWLTKVTDNGSETIEYNYTANGSPSKIIMNGDAAHAISYRYNLLGKVDSIQDPHLGKITYSYSPFGDIIRQTNARNQVTSFNYDKLGRPTVSSSPEGVTRWYYDSQPHGIGQLDYSQFFFDNAQYYRLTKSCKYDKMGRLIRSTQDIDGDTASYAFNYDIYGNQNEIIYPSGFVVQTEYDKKGFTAKISNPVYGTLWKLVSQNPFGSVNSSELGSVYSSNKCYNSQTDRLVKIRLMLKSPNKVLYEGNYNWNIIGNMTSRTDSIRGLEETFQYTSLNQLENSFLNGVLTSNITYGNLGNFNSRSDIGTFTYGENNAGPQAVTSIQTQNGVFPSTTQSVLQYTSFEKIKEMNENPWALKVLYDEAGQKLIQSITNTQSQETATTLYQGFSEKVTSNGMVKTTDYIASPEGVIAIFTRNNNTDSTLHYILKDYAGSMIGILNPNGTYAQEMNYDPWGRRRDPATWQAFNITPPPALYSRGYTMHEHLAHFGLIDMKGRVYDPLVGRFLSPDPFIQAPEFSLSFNRYSYCLNNPLLYTDPTGFFAEGPDIGTSGFYNNLSIDDDLGNVNSSIETGCNTHRQTDWVKDKPGQEAYFDKNVTSKDDPDLKGRIYVGKTFIELRENNFLYYGDEKGDLYQDPRPIFSFKEDTREADGQGGYSGDGPLFTAADWTNNGIGGFASGMQRTGGTFRLSNSTGFSPKHYASGWRGNGYVTTYNTATWGSRIAKGSLLVNIGLGAYSINKANIADGRTFGYNTQVATGQVAGGMVGSWAGAEAGAAAGAAIGVWFGGVGTVPGAIIGGVVGGVLGGWGGSELGGATVKWAY